MKVAGTHWRIDNIILKKILLCLITFVSYFLGIVFFIHSQSLFLDKIGPQQLPVVMAEGALLIIFYSMISSFLGRKLSAPMRFALFTLVISAFYALVYFLTGTGNLQITVFFLVSGFFYDFLDITITNVLSSLMTPLQAKSTQPLINSFNSLGVILGSYFALNLQNFQEKTGLGIFSAVSLFSVVLLALIAVKVFKKDLDATVKLEQQQKSGSQNEFKKSIDLIFNRSNLFKTLAFVIFLMIAIQIYSEFKLKTIVSLNFKGDQLTDIFSKVYMIESAFSFLIDFFFTEKLLFRFGIGRTLLAYPIIMMIFLLMAVFTGMPMLLVIVFTLSCSIPIYSSITVAISQIFALTPQKESDSVYFVIMGVIRSLAKFFITLTLFAYTFDLSLEPIVNTGLLAFLIVMLFIALIKLGRYYQSDVKENIYKDDIYLKHRAIELLAEKIQRNKGEIYLRRLLMLKNIDTETKLKTINSLGIIGNYDSIINLVKVLKEGKPKEIFASLQAINTIIRNRKKFDHYPVTKHLLLRVYDEMFISNLPYYIKLEIISGLKHFNLDEVIDFLEKNLAVDDPQIKMNILEMLGTFHDRGIISYIDPFLEDKNLKVVASAIIAMWQFQDMRVYLIPKMSLIFSQNSQDLIESSLFVIGSIKADWERNYVEEKIKSDNPHVRIYALITMIHLGEREYIDEFLVQFINLAKKVFGKKDQAAHDEISIDLNSEIEFCLSQYRKFDVEMKDLFIAKIQQLPVEDVHVIAEAFEHSKYIFSQELEDLSL